MLTKHCTHDGVVKVMTLGSCEVWAGRERDVLPVAGRFDVVISLLGKLRRTALPFSLSRGSRRVFANLAAYQQRRNNFILIDWPDMSTPELDRLFWEALAADLMKVNGKAVIFCMGGHGRTGTALTALAHVSQHVSALNAPDLVQWVRHHYCVSAVETASQIRYLKEEIGVQTTSHGAMESIRHGGGSFRDEFYRRGQAVGTDESEEPDSYADLWPK